MRISQLYLIIDSNLRTVITYTFYINDVYLTQMGGGGGGIEQNGPKGGKKLIPLSFVHLEHVQDFWVSDIDEPYVRQQCSKLQFGDFNLTALIVLREFPSPA